MSSDELPTENYGKFKPPSNRNRTKQYKKHIEAAASIRENTVTKKIFSGTYERQFRYHNIKVIEMCKLHKLKHGLLY